MDDIDTKTEDVNDQTTDDTASEESDAPADDSDESAVVPVAPVAPLNVDPIVASKLPPSQPGDLYQPEKADSGVKFHLNIFGPNERHFSKDEHGESWKDIASEFFKTNASKIVAISYL